MIIQGKSMLRKLERLIKELGIAQVANDLGYRSTTTVRNWINNRRIPALARVKVKAYLEGK